MHRFLALLGLAGTILGIWSSTFAYLFFFAVFFAHSYALVTTASRDAMEAEVATWMEHWGR